MMTTRPLSADAFAAMAGALAATAAVVRQRFPSAQLVPNALGNFGVMTDGRYVGYVDMSDGRLVTDEDRPEP